MKRCVVLESVAGSCIDSCEASGRAGLPPAPHHPIFARPDTRPRAFKGSRLKANPACGRYDISGCSGAVHGSRLLAATIFNRHAAGLGDWLARSPRSESAAHGSDRPSAAFYAPKIDKIIARLTSVVTWKRVAAHQVMRRRVRGAGGRWLLRASSRVVVLPGRMERIQETSEHGKNDGSRR